MVQKISRKRVLSASLVVLTTLGLAEGALAQPKKADSAIEDVVVLGTRRTDRTVTTSASPIDVISATEFKSQPAGNMLDLIKNIVPSFFVGQNTISDASSIVRAPSLRGLPSDELLVMLNGKRLNRSALVQVYNGGDTALAFGSQGADINSIPSIAIRDLQILRDGATAQYGSDAIAGVFNYGLKGGTTGVDVDARYGQYYKNGDGQSKQIAASFGYSFNDRGFIQVSGEYDDDDGTSRGVTRPLALQFAQQNPSQAGSIPNYPGLPAQIWGSSPTHGYKILANSAFDITSSDRLYAFANFAENNVDESFNYRSPIDGSAIDATGARIGLNANGAFRSGQRDANGNSVRLPTLFYLTPCPAGNRTCPAGSFVKDTNTFSFLSLYPGGFTPRFLGTATQKYGTVGYKGEFKNGLTYDVSGSLSENALELSMNQSLSPSFGEKSQTSFKFGTLTQQEQNANLDLTYPINVTGLASPITLSGGGEYRKETYKSSAGDPQSYGAGPYASPQRLYTQVSPGVYQFAGTTAALSPGASGYGGTSPNAAGSWNVTSYAFYTGAEADITKQLTVGLAGRYENYDTFGDTTVGKANAIYKFTDSFSLRGTVGSGFHAPTPGQLNTSILTTNFIGGNQVQTGTYPVTSPISLYYGSKTLSPEESQNYGLGFVAKPTSSTTLTVDAYKIDVTNRIGISRVYVVTAADITRQPALAAVGEGGNVQYFTNGTDTSTRGLDVVATQKFDEVLGGGLSMTLAYNYNKSRVSKFDPATTSPDQIINVGRLAPNHRGTLSAAWNRDNFTVNGRVNYYGSWRNETDYPGQKFDNKTTFDLDISYEFMSHYTLTVGAQNLFDTYPDKIAQSAANSVFPITGGLADGQVYPRNGGPFGINGGFWYTRVRVSY